MSASQRLRHEIWNAFAGRKKMQMIKAILKVLPTVDTFLQGTVLIKSFCLSCENNWFNIRFGDLLDCSMWRACYCFFGKYVITSIMSQSGKKQFRYARNWQRTYTNTLFICQSLNIVFISLDTLLYLCFSRRHRLTCNSFKAHNFHG